MELMDRGPRLVISSIDHRLTCISYNMGTSALPDMYARSPRAEGIHIRQSTSAHVITNMLHF